MKQLQSVTSSIFWRTIIGKRGMGAILVWMMSFLLATFSLPAFSAIGGVFPPPVVVIVSPAPNSDIPLGAPVTLVGTATAGLVGISATSWSLASKPAGSAATVTQTTFSGANPSAATFTPDIPGAYIVVFTARDNVGQERSDGIQLNALPAAPVANAGADISVALGGVVNLDGSGSTGTITSYSWSIVTAPVGSNAALSDASIVNPTFVADKAGSYLVRLTVVNAAGSSSDDLAVSTINTKPVADAGVDLSGLLGSVVQLNGSQSYDLEGDAITYQWLLTTVPAGSAAVLSNPTAVNPTFVLDKAGNYVAQLIVNDGRVDSDPDTVAISTINTPPIASAGSSRSVPVGTLVTLDGSASADAETSTLIYAWSFTSKPAGSAAVLANATSVRPTFTPDLGGSYVIQLIVNDGQVNSLPSTVSVLATISQTSVINKIQNLETTISGINSDVMKNKNMQKTLNNKLNSVIQNVQDHDYAEALSQLQNDILGKVDGCAIQNAPDKNDWISDCNVQNVIYLQVKSIIADIKGLSQ